MTRPADLSHSHIEHTLRSALPGLHIYAHSFARHEHTAYCMVRTGLAKWLAAVAIQPSDIPDGLEGNTRSVNGLVLHLCPLSHENAAFLREVFPWTAPISLRGRRTTFGFGDRLGCATVGHIQAARRYQVAPVLAQQSIRELTLTGRTFPRVVDDATFQVFQVGWRDGFGADGDHLKTIPEIRRAIDAGMPMITLDLTEVLPDSAETWSDDQVLSRYNDLPSDYRRTVEHEYIDKSFELEGLTIRFSDRDVRRCAAVYHDALAFAREVDAYLLKHRGENRYDLEISIDETTIPTLPADHLFLALELKRLGVRVTSLAPRFIGEFQKGIDYIGDLKTFEEHLTQHCAIARHFRYRISVHSGSDKFSVYPLIGRLTGLHVHVKTAGTSWLEALRTIAQADPILFRSILRIAIDRFEEALQYYHVTPDMDAVPSPESLSDDDLPALLDQDAPRQVLHVSYGTLLRDSQIAPLIRETLLRYEEQYTNNLLNHFQRHLETLGVPRRPDHETPPAAD